MHYSVSSEHELALLHGRRIENWAPVDVREVDDSAIYQNLVHDVPWTTYSCGSVVSQKFRELIERDGRAAAQFLPVRMLRDGRELQEAGQYWIVNWLTSIDCVDWDRSVWTEMDSGMPLFARLTIAPGKIPSDVSVFRVLAGPDVILFRSDLARKVRRAGISGAQFSPATVSPQQTM